MSQDIANLSFNIDSSSTSRANQQLMLLGERSTFAADHAQTLSRVFNQVDQAASQLGNTFQSFGGQLQDVVHRLQAARTALDGTASSFRSFADARENAQAMAAALGSSAQGLENFSRQATSFGMSAQQTEAALNRVTQAILAQTAAGRQLRAIMQDYGVNFHGLTPANADQAMEQFIYNAQRYRPTQINQQAMQTVLGPINPIQLNGLMQPDMETPYQRRLREQMEGLSRRVTGIADNAGRAGDYWQREVRLASGYEDTYRMREWYTPFLHPLSPRAGLSHTQVADIMRRLHLSGDPYSRENELQIFRYAEQHPELRRAAQVWQWGDLSRAAFPMVAPGTYGAYKANYGAELTSRLAHSESGWLNPTAWGEWGSAEGHYWGQRARLFGAWATGQLGRMTPPAPVQAPERPLSPYEIEQQRLFSAQHLAEMGFYGAAGYASAENRLRALQRGSTPGQPNLAQHYLGQLYGDENAAPRYANAIDIARRQRDLAIQPGANELLSAEAAQWLLRVPAAQRGRARALLEFAQGNGVSTQPWFDHLSYAAVNGGMVSGAGALAPDQLRAFNRIQGLQGQNFQSQEHESLSQYQAIQERLQAAIPRGSGAVQQATAFWQAYFAALNAGRDTLQATTAAMTAQNKAVADNATAMRQALEVERQQQNSSDLGVVLLRRAGGAQATPVARLGAGIEAGLTTDVENMRRLYGPNWTDAIGQRYLRGRRGILADHAETFGMGTEGDARYQLQALRRFAGNAGAQPIDMEQFSSDLQVERQFQDALAEAIQSDDPKAVTALQKTMQTVKQLNLEFGHLQENARVMEAVRQQATTSERGLFLLQSAGGAGASPVDRLGAGLAADVETGVYGLTLRHASPMMIEIYRANRARDFGAQAETFGTNADGDAGYRLQVQRRLTTAAGGGGAVLERVNSDIEVEKQFQQAVADAMQAADLGNRRAMTAVQKHMQAVKELNAEYEQLQRTARHVTFNRDLGLDVGLQGLSLGMGPAGQRQFRALQPVLQEYRSDPNLMGHPTAFMGGLGMRGAQYDSYFLQASAATGGRLSPEVLAVLGYREGSFLADPPSGTGGPLHRGMMQFDPDTARRMHLTVDPTHHIDQRLDPTRAIPAAGAFLGQIMDRLGIHGPVTDLATLHKILGAGGYGSSFNPQIDALYQTALAAPETNPDAVFQRLMQGGSADPQLEASRVWALRQQSQGEFGQNQQAQWSANYANARRSAATRAILAGAGSFGARIAADNTVNPSIPAVLAQGNRQRSLTADFGGFSQTIGEQSASLEQTARNLRDLAAAYQQGTLAGEAFQRTIANSETISQLQALERLYPELAQRIDPLISKLRAYNQEIDKNNAAQVAADWHKQNAATNDQNELTLAGMAQGPLASPEAVQLAQARVRAQRTAAMTASLPPDQRVTVEQAFDQQKQQIYLQQQVRDLQSVRQGFQQMGSDAMDAFNTAVVGSERLHYALYSITKDIESLALKTFVEQPFLNLIQHSVFDPISSGIGSALGFGGSTPSAGQQAAGVASKAATGAATSSLFSSIFSGIGSLFSFADGGVINERGQPTRYLASGGVLDRPTMIYAAGGTVMAAENKPEGVLPLMRLPNGNLGVQASGGSGGPQIIVQAPVTIHGGTGGNGNQPMDPATTQLLQRHFEMVATKAVRNVLANEMRPGGDLYMAGASYSG